MRWKQILFIGMFILLFLLCFVSCSSRRSNIQNNMETVESTDLYNKTSFYENMAESDMMFLYDNNVVLDAPTARGSVVNTPYYYIIADSGKPGGYAYSKLSNSFVTMCTDPYCNHYECVFAKTIEEYIVYESRIYYLVSEHPFVLNPTQKYSLYSSNLTFNDLRLEFEFPTSVESQYEVVDKGGYEGMEMTFVATISDLCIYHDKIYYNDYTINTDGDIIETIYVLDLPTKEITIMLHDTVASSVSLYGDVLSWNDEDGNDVYYNLINNQYVNYYTPPVCNIILSSDYKLRSRVVCEQYSYITVDHGTTMFAEDPYFSYYTEISSKGLTARDLFKRNGGDIYRIKTDGSDNGEPELLVTMTTDGIPDVIYWFYTDGKTLIVCYETYKDFENEYNASINESEFDGTIALGDVYYYKYAIIDLELGTVYKPNA